MLWCSQLYNIRERANDAVLWIFAFHFRKQMYLYPVPIKVLAAQRFHSDNPVHTPDLL